MDTFIHYGMAAGLQAWRDAGVDIAKFDPERAGINFGSGIGGLPMIEATNNELLKSGPKRISPFFIPSTIINMIDPDVIVLGGGLSNVERLYENVPQLWSQFVFSDRVGTRLVRAVHGDASGVRGAAWLWASPGDVTWGRNLGT
jgi:hypothetical protein